MRDVETAIIGGGPAGAAAACALAASGRETVLFERSAGPHHKVCGEFLSIETQALLREIGIDPPALGAVGIDYVAIYAAGRSIGAALPFRALSLHHVITGHRRQRPLTRKRLRYRIRRFAARSIWGRRRRPSPRSSRRCSAVPCR